MAVGATHATHAAHRPFSIQLSRPLFYPAKKTEGAEAGGASTEAAAMKAQVRGVQPIQLHPPHASIGEPSPQGALGIAGGAPPPAPPLELPPPEPPLDVEPLVPLPVVVLDDAPMSLQYVGS